MESKLYNKFERSPSGNYYVIQLVKIRLVVYNYIGM